MSWPTSSLRPRRLLPAALALVALSAVLAGCHEHSDSGGGIGVVPAEIVIQNNTGETITAVFISPSSDSFWGTNDLVGTVILNGGSFRFTDVPPGLYDIAADGDFGGRWETFDVFLDEAEVFTWTVVP